MRPYQDRDRRYGIDLFLLLLGYERKYKLLSSSNGGYEYEFHFDWNCNIDFKFSNKSIDFHFLPLFD